MNGSARGTSLLECAAALALAGMSSLELGRSLHASASMLGSARVQMRALDVARNLLESELGSPCGAPYVCPPEFLCSVSRNPEIAPGVDRVLASATRGRGGTTVELAVLVRTPACS